MKLSLFQLTLRRWQEILCSPLFFAMIGGCVVLGTVVGPYGSSETLNLLERFALSVETNFILWTIGTIIAVPVRLAIQRVHTNRMLAVGVACLVASVAITPAWKFLIFMRLGEELNSTKYVEFSIMFLFITWAMVYISVRLSKRSAGGEQADDSSSQEAVLREVQMLPEALAKKVPFNKVGKLYALIAHDHYVEIITERGAHLVLMRLSDAVAEVDEDHGMMTHRSAWVSFGAVDFVKREKRKAVAVLLDGREVPVARAQENDLRLRMSQLMVLPSQSDVKRLAHPIS